MANEGEEEVVVSSDTDQGEFNFDVDFSHAGEVPAGELLLEIEAVKGVMSKSDNRQLQITYKIIGGEADAEHPEGRWNDRKIFGFWMLETGMIDQTFKLAAGFVPGLQKTNMRLTPDILVGRQAWCLVIAEDGKKEYAGTKRSTVKSTGISVRGHASVSLD